MRVINTRSRIESGDAHASYHRAVALGGLNLDNRSQLALLASHIDMLQVWRTYRSTMLSSVVAE